MTKLEKNGIKLTSSKKNGKTVGPKNIVMAHGRSVF